VNDYIERCARALHEELRKDEKFYYRYTPWEDVPGSERLRACELARAVLKTGKLSEHPRAMEVAKNRRMSGWTDIRDIFRAAEDAMLDERESDR
jgi:hypothetical protein